MESDEWDSTSVIVMMSFEVGGRKNRRRNGGINEMHCGVTGTKFFLCSESVEG